MSAQHASRTPSRGTVDRDAIVQSYIGEGLTPRRWSSAPGDAFAAHRHAQHKVLHCLRGSITFLIVATGESIELSPGDRLDLPAGVEHAAVAGAGGCECVEAYRGAE